MIGPEQGRYREKVAPARRRRARRPRSAGFASVWVPQIPDDFDALTAVALMGAGDDAGSSSAPRSCRSRPAIRSRWRSRRCRPRRCAKGGSRSASGRRTTGSSTTCSACRTSDRRDVDARLPRGARTRRSRGPGPVDVENDDFRVHNPLDITDIAPTPVLLAALAPVMLRIAGEHADGTILWMADERAIGEHVVPAHHARPRATPGGRRRDRRRRPGRAVRATTRSTPRASGPTSVLGHAEYSPNYQRLLEHGDATDVGDMLAAGGEASVVRSGCGRSATRASPTSRCASSRSARTATSASSRGSRTEAFLASLCPELLT